MTPSAWRPFTVVDTVVANTAVGITGSGKIGTPLTVNPVPGWNFGPASPPRTSGTGGPRRSAAKPARVRAHQRRPDQEHHRACPGHTSGLHQRHVDVQRRHRDLGVGAGRGDRRLGHRHRPGRLVLALNPPTWDSDQVTSSYRWQRDGVDVRAAPVRAPPTRSSRATSASRSPSRRPGLAPATSRGRRPAPGPRRGRQCTAATTDVTISGPSTKVGQTWTVTAPTWDTTGVSTTYQWYRDDTAIARATRATYKLAAADIGVSVTARATGTKAGYLAGSSTSNAVVAEQLDTNTNIAPPTITGVAAARETLTANPGTWPGGRRSPISGSSTDSRWPRRPRRRTSSAPATQVCGSTSGSPAPRRATCRARRPARR